MITFFLRLSLLISVLAPNRPVAATQLPRLLEPPFEREECERHILNAPGRRLRKASIEWVAGWPVIPLTPGSHQPTARPEETSEAFAVFIAPPGTRKDELLEIKNEVERANKAWETFRQPAPPATVLTPLHKLVLNIGSDDQILFDQITTRLIVRDRRRLILKTRRGRDTLGTRVLDLNELRIGYAGDPYYWVYEEWLRQTAEGGRAPIDVNRFLDARSVFVLKPRGHVEPNLYFVIKATNAADDEERLELMEIEAFTGRPTHPGSLTPSDLRAPGLTASDGRQLKFTSTGMKLTAKSE